MKLQHTIPVVLGILALSAYQARAVDPVRAPGVDVNTPAADVRVGDQNQGTRGINVQSGPGGTGVSVAAPNVGVGVQAPAPPIATEARAEANRITDNRHDPWRYKYANDRWWYWSPENRWMTYSSPGGWTYYEPSGSYTTGYGGVAVAPPAAGYVAPQPATTYYYPDTTYYYGYPGSYYGYRGRYYYGGPGVYLGGPRWGVRVWWPRVVTRS